MMKYLAILLALFLTGCARETPTQAIVDTAITAVKDLKKDLPKECQTEKIYKDIDRVESLINTVPKTCELQVQNIRIERNSYALGFFVMIAFALWSLLRRFLR
jgi:hypothetical protein